MYRYARYIPYRQLIGTSVWYEIANLDFNNSKIADRPIQNARAMGGCCCGVQPKRCGREIGVADAALCFFLTTTKASTASVGNEDVERD
ncbi:hypothetical protein B296_00009348 [Ensete ventricosum]|uniref:Uncharacterized protein n=1 Tax=Ensete ventricosum TaxID=4639 RepID=A0A426ZR78_ENSVE|nr:hypothetical protein B296_00009348 [Ensete ventricosum]